MAQTQTMYSAPNLSTDSIRRKPLPSIPLPPLPSMDRNSTMTSTSSNHSACSPGPKHDSKMDLRTFTMCSTGSTPSLECPLSPPPPLPPSPKSERPTTMASTISNRSTDGGSRSKTASKMYKNNNMSCSASIHSFKSSDSGPTNKHSSRPFTMSLSHTMWRVRTDYDLMSSIRLRSPPATLREEISAKNDLVDLWERTLLDTEECCVYDDRKPFKPQFKASRGVSTLDFARQFLVRNAEGLPQMEYHDGLIKALEEFWWARIKQWKRLFKGNRGRVIKNWEVPVRSERDGEGFEALVMECSYGEWPHRTSVRMVVCSDEEERMEAHQSKERGRGRSGGGMMGEEKEVEVREPVWRVIATKDCHPECGRKHRDDRRLRAVMGERQEEVRHCCRSVLAKEGLFQGVLGGSAFDWT